MPAVTEIIGPAAVVTLDWPSVRNALTVDDMTAVAAAVRDAVRAHRGVSALVLTGNGAFCAGANLRLAHGRPGRWLKPQDHDRGPGPRTDPGGARRSGGHYRRCLRSGGRPGI